MKKFKLKIGVIAGLPLLNLLNKKFDTKGLILMFQKLTS